MPVPRAPNPAADIDPRSAPGASRLVPDVVSEGESNRFRHYRNPLNDGFADPTRSFLSLWNGFGGTSKTNEYDDLESLDVELKTQNARRGGYECHDGASGKVGSMDDTPKRSSVPYPGPLGNHGITKTMSLDIR